MKDITREGEEKYREHLEEIKAMHREKAKKQKEMCELEYKRHSEHLNKSMNNYQ